MSHGTPDTYDPDTQRIIFQQQYPRVGHTWIILKAIELLKADGRSYQAKIAERYLLSMLQGATFIDVWGDSDYDGSQILHYYCPDNRNENYGFGSPGKDPARLRFKNATWEYKNHPFYGYGNAAEYAQNRYDAAKRAALRKWGSHPQDFMAAWVVDTVGGQEDAISYKWQVGKVCCRY